jgi:8-oxo-dGTP pyrophosphatase MutT (NUDIX family)
MRDGSSRPDPADTRPARRGRRPIDLSPAGDEPSVDPGATPLPVEPKGLPYIPPDEARLRRAVRFGPSIPSSDYDLNPGALDMLPADRRLRPASVLCPLILRESGLNVILTRRADHLKHHPGQVAFPGGKQDPGDPSPAHAALREAEEEIGLRPDQVELIGPIDGHETVTGFQVTPYVGLVSRDFVPVIDPSEVAEVFESPLAYLMDPANHRRSWRMWNGGRRYFYEMPWEGQRIWGATARMLVGLSLRLASTPAEAE